MINRKSFTIITIITLLLISSLFLIEAPNILLSNYIKILTNPSILLTDYLSVAGLAATLFNVITITYINILIIYLINCKIDGVVIASLLTIIGFAFFGKNILNTLPIYLGIYIYSKVIKTELKSHITALLLSTGISPLISYILFGLGLELYIGIPLSISVGIIIGYIIPIFNTYATKFHQGFNIYSYGFSMGILSAFANGIILAFGGSVNRVNLVNTDYHYLFFYSLLIISLILVIVPLLTKVRFKDYQLILKEEGILSTDFIEIAGIKATILNIGVVSLILLFITFVFNFKLSGPSVGAILCVIGFAAFGKHPNNTITILIGALLGTYLSVGEFSQGAILSIFFATGLAPIAGRYGLIAGLITGFIHVLIAPITLPFQGGFDLYNNGFTAGFVAAVLVPVFTHFKNGFGHVKNE